MKDLLSPKDIVESGLCIGCGSCVAQSQGTSMQFDHYGELKPRGPAEWYKQGAESFTRTCPFSPSAANEDHLASQLFPASGQKHVALGHFQKNYVGHVSEQDFRVQGSSGGMVTWVATELLKRGLIDGIAHVIATEDPQTQGRYFEYRISRTEDEIRQGAKSRYYPIELSQVLQAIHEMPGRYAVIAVPCMIKAIHLLRREYQIYNDRIRFTLGLFCGHMKSARFVESFAWQMKVRVDDVKRVEFRYKDPNRPANLYNAMLTLKDGQVVNKDWWHLADGDWGAGFFMNSACNFCDDVMAETADISFGDAWIEPYSSDGKGTNVVIVRSPIVADLIETAIGSKRLCLSNVDAELVEQTQAAGLRQRREGLAYRLTWAAPSKLGLKKRVAANAHQLSKDRKQIYRMRYFISKWSHRMFRVAQQTKSPRMYLGWARLVAAIYHGLAYHQAKFTEMIKRFFQLKP